MIKKNDHKESKVLLTPVLNDYIDEDCIDGRGDLTKQNNDNNIESTRLLTPVLDDDADRIDRWGDLTKQNNDKNESKVVLSQVLDDDGGDCEHWDGDFGSDDEWGFSFDDEMNTKDGNVNNGNQNVEILVEVCHKLSKYTLMNATDKQIEDYIMTQIEGVFVKYEQDGFLESENEINCISMIRILGTFHDVIYTELFHQINQILDDNKHINRILDKTIIYTDNSPIKSQQNRPYYREINLLKESCNDLQSLAVDCQCYVMNFLYHQDVIRMSIVSRVFFLMVQHPACFTGHILIDNVIYFAKWLNKTRYKMVESMHILFQENKNVNIIHFEMIKNPINRFNQLKIIRISLWNITNFHNTELFINLIHTLIANAQPKTIIFDRDYNYFGYDPLRHKELMFTNLDTNTLQKIENIVFTDCSYLTAQRILSNIWRNPKICNMCNIKLRLGLNVMANFNWKLFEIMTANTDGVDLELELITSTRSSYIYKWRQFFYRLRNMTNQFESIKIELAVTDRGYKTIKNIYNDTTYTPYPISTFVMLKEDGEIQYMQQNGMKQMQIVYEIVSFTSCSTKELLSKSEQILTKYCMNKEWISWKRVNLPNWIKFVITITFIK